STQRLGDLPNLHSFPTRRSSDLAFNLNREVITNDIRARKKPMKIFARMPVSIFYSDQRPRKCMPATAQSLLKRLLFRKHSVASRDRKSTRLNSSHEWISYAVFCL